ncbi:hypothetical protein IPA_09025 [Ignicoccus pacificus DSM 13166]|uniref:DUF4395 domain-containing protein n=1 Tax=Ignicoccus pacificus DSM 13166 TaxID=940294 RepID=A0A977PKH2_9CREN|nr:hypothetical protein IPA_09025 [Ignicoccus pacificus DSM 13166]
MEYNYLQFNAVFLAMLFAGTVFQWTLPWPPLSYAWSVFWLALSAYLLYYYLRKHLCTNCVFYGKPCFSGWGLLASKLFPKGSGDFDKGRRVAPLAWTFFLLPPFLATIITGRSLGAFIWFFASLYLILTFNSFHSKCPMRDKCLTKPR